MRRRVNGLERVQAAAVRQIQVHQHQVRLPPAQAGQGVGHFAGRLQLESSSAGLLQGVPQKADILGIVLDEQDIDFAYFHVIGCCAATRSRTMVQLPPAAPPVKQKLRNLSRQGASHLRRDFDFTETPEEAEQKFS